MQHCGKCGDYNPDESIFCGHCGNRLNYNCPFCGFSNLPQQEFCGGCGKQVANQVPAPTPPQRPVSPPPPPPSSRPPVVEPPAPPTTPVAEKPLPVEPAPPPATPVAAAVEEERFIPYQTLGEYALFSIECVLADSAQSAGITDPKLEEARNQCLRAIEQRVLALNGHMQINKTRIAFIAFKQEASLPESLKKAIDLCLSLIKQNLLFQGVPLMLKIGLDIEKAAARDPLTSTLERAAGRPGTLIISEAAYQHVREHYRVEALAPIQMGNRTLQVYRVISPGVQLPEPQTVLEPQKAPEKPQVVPPEPVSPTPTSSAPPVHEAPPIEHVEEPVQEASQGTPPQLPEYIEPVYGVYKTEKRAFNIDYAQAIEAIQTDLSAFLAQGGTARGRVIAINADNGLGKSSIIHMVRSKIDPQNEKAIWLGGANYRSFESSKPPLFYWIEVLQNMMSFIFEGQERPHVQAQIEKFLAFIYEGQVPQDEAAFLFDFLLVNPLQPLGSHAGEFSGRLQRFFLEFFRHLSRKRPLILVFEDAQHADTASMELLKDLLSQGLLNLPVCILLTQTPDFYESGSLATVMEKGAYKVLNISPLSDAEAERFLNDGPLGGQLAEFPTPLIDSVVRYAEGLPLYLEEALRLLHLRGVLTVDENTHKFKPGAAYNAENAFLPHSLESIIRERLEHLSEATRYILQVASVLGERFSVSMLLAVSQAEEDDFNQALSTLFNHGYLIPDAVNTGRFRHSIIWQTVYDSLEPQWRQQMHQLISEALEHDFQQGLTVQPALIAHHAELGNLPVRALNFWNLAGIFAGRLGAWTGMNMALLRALELLKRQEGPLSSKELALRIAETLGALNIHHQPALAVGWLEWAIYHRRLAGDSPALIEPLGALTSAYEAQGDFPKALSTLEETLELIDAGQYPLEAASLQVNRMEYLVTMGRYQQARKLMEADIEPLTQSELAQKSEFQDAYLQARLLYGQVLTAQCDPNTLTYLEETNRRATEQGLQGLSVAVQLTQTLALLHSGQYEVCNREADTLLQAIEQMEQSDWFLAQWGLLAMMYHCELEDWESASQLTLTVLSKAEESRDYGTFITAQAHRGYITGKLGKIQEARQMLEQALQQASDRRMAGAALIGWRLLADFELSLGNQEVAYELSAKALEIAQKPEICNQYEVLQLSILCARALLAYGELKTAGKVLERLWLQAVQSKMRPIIAACAAEIGQLYKQLAHNAPADLSKKHLMRSTEFFLKAKGIWLELRHLSNVKRVDLSMPRL
jgi:tetratricopeptide (TPR) repeat protein